LQDRAAADCCLFKFEDIILESYSYHLVNQIS